MPILISQMLSFLSVGAVATGLQYALTTIMVLLGWLRLVEAPPRALTHQNCYSY